MVVGGTSSGYSGLEGDVQGASEHAGEQGKENIHKFSQSVDKLRGLGSWSCAIFGVCRSNEGAREDGGVQV